MEKKIGIVFSPFYEKHQASPSCPEIPLRITTVIEALKNEGLLTERNLIPPRAATREELLLCHSSEWVDEYKKLADSCTDDQPIQSFSPFPGELDACKDSFQAASLAAGGVIQAVDTVMDPNQPFNKVFCAVRPPGHHAGQGEGMGFCPFNNVAIGAQYALMHYPDIKKVLIVDWDVHHGNGTEEIFYESGKVFYFSTHFYGAFYPGTGSADDIGRGEGREKILNVPISSREGFRDIVLDAFRSALQKKMKEFQPDIVFISAGFDAHTNDPMGAGNMTDEDFSEITLITQGIADSYSNGRLISVLEGGYGVDGTLAGSVVSHLKALEAG